MALYQPIKLEEGLSGIAETALMSVWARAVETGRSDAIVRDEKAVELVRTLEYDFDKFKTAWMAQLGIAIRTRILDDAVAAFTRDYPECVVVNLGAGLDDRFHRLDNGRLRWYEVDLPDVIAIRRRHFNENHRYRFIGRSIFDMTWMREVQICNRPVLLIAEGLLMYFRETALRPLFDELVNCFAGSELLFELIPYGALGTRRYHDALSTLDVEFKWSLRDSQEIESWNRKIRFIEQWCILDYYRHRWGWVAWWADLPLFRMFFGERIVRVRFQP